MLVIIPLLRNVETVCLSHWDLPNHDAPPTMLSAALESPQWVGVHQGGLVVHRPTQQDLLNTEQFFQRKLKKIKTKS